MRSVVPETVASRPENPHRDKGALHQNDTIRFGLELKSRASAQTPRQIDAMKDEGQTTDAYMLIKGEGGKPMADGCLVRT